MSACIYCNIFGKDNRHFSDQYSAGASISDGWKRITVLSKAGGKCEERDIDVCDNCIAIVNGETRAMLEGTVPIEGYDSNHPSIKLLRFVSGGMKL